jgi:hypothetical protein
MPITTIRALPAPTGAPRGLPATLPTCRRRSINDAVTPVVNALGVADPIGIGARVLRNGWSGAPESAVGSSRNQRSGHVGTRARVRPEYAMNHVKSADIVDRFADV